MAEYRQIEINGVKMEVDMSTARKVDEYKVGDNVKVLRKSYSGYTVYAGVITEFVNFKNLPTIVIAVFRDDYSGSDIEFIYFNEEAKDVELCPACEHEIELSKDSAVDKFNARIEKAKNEVEELTAKRDWFVKHFAKHFGGDAK